MDYEFAIVQLERKAYQYEMECLAEKIHEEAIENGCPDCGGEVDVEIIGYPLIAECKCRRCGKEFEYETYK